MVESKDPYTRIRDAFVCGHDDEPDRFDAALEALEELEKLAPLPVLVSLRAWNEVPAASRSLVAAHFMRMTHQEREVARRAEQEYGLANLPVRASVLRRAEEAFQAIGVLALALAQEAEKDDDPGLWAPAPALRKDTP